MKPNPNKHATAIPSEVLAQATAKIEEAAALLKPYLLALTPKERQALIKIGDGTLAFADKGYESAKKHPDLFPSYQSLAELEADYADLRGLWPLHLTVKQLEESLSDTKMVAGSEALISILGWYNTIKAAAAQDVPGAKAIYEEMKASLPKRGRKAAKTDSAES